MLETISKSCLIRLHGGHFFSKETMRFFNSRLAEQGFKHGDGWLFVTSERYRNEPRFYTVRFINAKSGFIRTIGEFQQFKSSKEAHRYLHAVIKGEIEVSHE